jgi:uncharacterized membrane protein
MGLGGGVVASAAATLAVVLILLLPVARRDAAGIDPKNMMWFVWTGVTVCVSQIFMYLAMAIAPVTVVQPLMRISTVFRTLFAWMLNREEESFDAGVIAAIAISTLGAVAVSLNGAAIMQSLDAPSWLVAAFAWSWP